MGLNYDMARYTALTGEDGTKVSIIRLGSYLDGYEKGRVDAIDEVTSEIFTIIDMEAENLKLKIINTVEQLKEQKNE